MAQGKKSFLLYADLIHTVELLNDEQAGLLFKYILEYVNDRNPAKKDILIELVFQPIKYQLKRDLVNWENRAERSRLNGMKGGRPKNPKKPSRLLNNPEEPRKPVTVTVNGNVNDINKRKMEFDNSLQPFNEKYGLQMISEFYYYWSEHNENGKKMRFEMSKNQPFNLSRRLVTWKSRSKSTEKKEGAMTELMKKHNIKK